MSPEEIAALPYRPNVGVMLVNPKGKIFVAQRIDSPGPAWQMPQGGIDKGEKSKAAALRELEEETGVVADLVTIVTKSKGWLRYDFPLELVSKVTGGRFRGQQQRWYLMQYHGNDDQITIETKHPEFSNWKWSEPSELVANIVPFKREVYAQVLAEFSDFLK